MGPLVECKVAALNLSPLDTYKYPPEVAWKLDQNSKSDLAKLAKTLNEDVNVSGIIIQHEYGIFGGLEKETALSFMQNCKKPMLVTLHTVLPNPHKKMKDITSGIVHFASTIVVLTNSSKKIIEELYPESIGKVFMIPHGIHSVVFSAPPKSKEKLQLQHHTILSTFGLLSSGKGIEYVLRALPDVIRKHPSILYLILGETHPIVRRQEGEKYRTFLTKLIIKLGLNKHVRFYDQYFSLPDLFSFLKATDVYISTSTNPNQAVSGTLSYALGAGRAVISTEFAQAKEIVTPQNGRLVPIKDSPAITKALNDILQDKKKLLEMHHNAYENTRPMLWDTIAEEYLSLLRRMIIPAMKIDHLVDMTDNFGLFQFASHSSPNKNFGYTLDDNARALIVCSWLLKRRHTKELETLLSIYLAFIKRCRPRQGILTNYLGLDKKPTTQNTTEDLQDSQARALWALSEVMTNTTLSSHIKDETKNLFLSYYKENLSFVHLRAKAFAIKSFAQILPLFPEKQVEFLCIVTTYANSLLSALHENSVKEWTWFESTLNYNNALLSESLLIAGDMTKNNKYTQEGLMSLHFLIRKTFSTIYMPIGHSSWYKNQETRSTYDQQPEDPASMILALEKAYTFTKDAQYKKLADTCFSWFLGNNSLKKSLYNYDNGGCYDGLHPDRVNLNEGAESLVSYMMSSFVLSRMHE